MGFSRSTWSPDSRHRRARRACSRWGTAMTTASSDTAASISSADAKVRFAHPLPVDDIAVDFRGVNFVLAHLGNPWTIDAAEVVYKNSNVYADLSGFLVGDAAYFEDPANDEGIGHAVERIREAFAWVEDPRKFLYGSDWPLVPMRPYLEFVGRAIEPEHQELVFSENARRVFGLPG